MSDSLVWFAGLWLAGRAQIRRMTRQRLPRSIGAWLKFECDVIRIPWHQHIKKGYLHDIHRVDNKREWFDSPEAALRGAEKWGQE